MPCWAVCILELICGTDMLHHQLCATALSHNAHLQSLELSEITMLAALIHSKQSVCDAGILLPLLLLGFCVLSCLPG